MQTVKRFAAVTAWAFASALLVSSNAGPHAYAQRGGQQGPPLTQPQFPPAAGSRGNDDEQQSAAKQNLEEKQAQARNTDRQKRLVADSDKLLALATQLHQDIGRTDKNILSMDVVRRAAEIEKLAHDVKERMKG